MTNEQLMQEIIKRVGTPMNINEAADYLRISKRKLQDLLPYINHSIVGGRRIFTKADLDQYIQDQKVY